MSFEVASIKPSKEFKPPTFPLDAGNAVTAGGRFSAGFALWTYITFAYKLSLTGDQRRAATAQLPKWVTTDFFQIEARAAGNATKDQMRLMMQSLLAERFNLKIHFETQEVPVMALTLDKPGKLGPNLHPHSEGPPCSDFQSLGAARDPAQPRDAFPPQCDITMATFKPGSIARMGARNTTPMLLARDVSLSGEVDRPVVDRTGLTGTFDYVMEYVGRMPGPPAPGTDSTAASDLQGPSYLQAVREQLGLKLVPARAPIQTIVIDHVERPSEN